MPPSAGDQAIDFFIKRAAISFETAVHHCRDQEFDKGAALFKEAYGYYKKAESYRPEDAELKEKVQAAKEKYQQAIADLKKKTAGGN